uniref:Uncharacterized protein n=1 Tax=Anguilla anguilla TaxID=7936 RepID=A0A0E9U7T1_ANGAN
MSCDLMHSTQFAACLLVPLHVQVYSMFPIRYFKFYWAVVRRQGR